MSKILSYQGKYNPELDMPFEMRRMANAIMSIKGVNCGAIVQPDNVPFFVLSFDSMKNLFFISRLLSRRYHGLVRYWTLNVNECSDQTPSPTFTLKCCFGGKLGFEKCIEFADKMNELFNHEGFIKHYEFKYEDFYYSDEEDIAYLKAIKEHGT